jgi:hypothetical protein
MGRRRPRRQLSWTAGFQPAALFLFMDRRWEARFDTLSVTPGKRQPELVEGGAG